MKKQNMPDPATESVNAGNTPEIVIPQPDTATNIIPYELPLNNSTTETHPEK